MHSPLRPMTLHQLDAKLDLKNKKIISWQHQIVGQSLLDSIAKDLVPYSLAASMPPIISNVASSTLQSVLNIYNPKSFLKGFDDQEYTFEIDAKTQQMESKIPSAFWRSVEHSFLGLVVEGFLDEIAHRFEKDPFSMRRSLLPKNSRSLQVLEKVAEIGQWKKARSPIRGGKRALGIACRRSFGTFVAEIADVEVIDKEIKVHEFFAVVDCGQVINPEIVKRQIASGIIFGLSAALLQEITFKDGVIEQDNFDSYPVMMLEDSPNIQVFIMDSNEKPRGVGEPGLPPSLPAVANAIFRATGQRLTSTPFRL